MREAQGGLRRGDRRSDGVKGTAQSGVGRQGKQCQSILLVLLFFEEGTAVKRATWKVQLLPAHHNNRATLT